MLDGEKRIIQDAVKGEASAFGLLYDHYQPQIYRFVVIKVGRREDAEDLTHQVFLSAWKKIGEYEHLGHPFSSWLYKIARNLVIDHYRTNKIEINLEEADDANDLGYVPSGEADVELSLAMDKVTEAIRRLSQSHQDIIVMRFVEDLSIKEISASLGESESVVKVRQHRAMQKLKKLLLP
jgi:RNA polymerase sigma-70 factor (ECF subfamily)